MFPRPFPRSVNLENLNCFSIIEGREEGGEKKKKQKKKGKAKKRQSGCKGAGQDAAGRPAGSQQSLSKPRLKNKGARATFQWKMSGDGPAAPTNRDLTQQINNKWQREALQEPQRDSMGWKRAEGRRQQGEDKEEQRERGNPPHLTSSVLRH